MVATAYSGVAKNILYVCDHVRFIFTIHFRILTGIKKNLEEDISKFKNSVPERTAKVNDKMKKLQKQSEHLHR